MQFLKQNQFVQMRQNFGVDENKAPNVLHSQYQRNNYANNKNKVEKINSKVVCMQRNGAATTLNDYGGLSYSHDVEIERINQLERSLPTIEEMCNMNWMGTSSSESSTIQNSGAARKFYEEFKYEIESENEEQLVPIKSVKKKKIGTAKKKKRAPKIPRCRTRIVEKVPLKIVTLREYRLQKEREQLNLYLQNIPMNKRVWFATTAKEYYERFKYELAEDAARQRYLAQLQRAREELKRPMTSYQTMPSEQQRFCSKPQILKIENTSPMTSSQTMVERRRTDQFMPSEQQRFCSKPQILKIENTSPMTSRQTMVERRRTDQFMPSEQQRFCSKPQILKIENTSPMTSSQTMVERRRTDQFMPSEQQRFCSKPQILKIENTNPMTSSQTMVERRRTDQFMPSEQQRFCSKPQILKIENTNPMTSRQTMAERRRTDQFMPSEQQRFCSKPQILKIENINPYRTLLNR